MGRPERPIDPAAGPLQRFAHDLRVLRRAAGGLSYREMSRQAHYSRTALSQAASGEELPSLTVTLAYVEACGGDPAEWEARWHAVEAEVAAERAVEEHPDGSCGLAAYQATDVDRFFGRGPLVDELVQRLGSGRFLAVFGASGSGKSSVLRAGLIPAVQSGRLSGSRDWPVVLLTPGEHPLAELAVHIAALQRVPSGALLAELQADPAAFGIAARARRWSGDRSPRSCCWSSTSSRRSSRCAVRRTSGSGSCGRCSPRCTPTPPGCASCWGSGPTSMPAAPITRSWSTRWVTRRSWSAR